MEADLGTISTKPGDYKVCNKCNTINWYENELCHVCNAKNFSSDMDIVRQWASDELQYWMEMEDYTDDSAMDITYCVG